MKWLVNTVVSGAAAYCLTYYGLNFIGKTLQRIADRKLIREGEL